MGPALVSLMGFLLIGNACALSVPEFPWLRGSQPDLPRTETQRGVASWYGREQQGQRTSSGERFDRHAFTAASRHFPLNSVVRVTNERNGRSVQVRVNDRGPFVHGRVLDLSEAAANTLGMKKAGTVPVKVELVAPPPRGKAKP